MTILYSKLSKAFLISLKRLSHIMAWKSKVIELLATSPASSFTPPFPATCAPDTPECLTLCQHSTCILYWGYCACCLLCLGYFSFIHFLDFFNYSNAASSETLSPYCIHPLLLWFFLLCIHHFLYLFACYVFVPPPLFTFPPNGRDFSHICIFRT